MANQNALFVKPPRMSELLPALAAFAKEVFPTDSVLVHVATNISGVDLSCTLQGQKLAEQDEYKNFLRNWGDKPPVVCVSAKVTNRNSGASLAYACPEGLVGEFVLEMDPDKSKAPKALEVLERFFKLTTYTDFVRTTSTVVDQAAIALREHSVADLQEILRKQSEFLTNLTQREVENRTKLLAEQNAAIAARTDALETEYRNRQAKLDEQKQQMEAEDVRRAKSHEERVAQFEMREAKAMRRENEKKLDKQLTTMESMSLSESTGKKRWWVHGAVAATLLATAAFSAAMVVKVYVTEPFDWHLLFPLSAGFLGFGGTMVYYLKWNDRWFREHADAELAAKRYKADILRASWIAELVAEWAKEGKGELPPGLIDAYTRNLFRDVTASKVSEHPIDDLTSLIKRANRVDLGRKGLSIRRGASADGTQG